MQHTLIVPDWVIQTVHFLERNWMGIVGIVLIAMITSLVTELVKHKWSVKYEENRAKALTRWLLLVVSSGFTLLGYLIFFVQGHESLLKQIPYVGQAEVQVLGAMWTLYNFKLNKTYKIWSARLAKWADKSTDASTLPQPTTTEIANPDQLAQ